MTASQASITPSRRGTRPTVRSGDTKLSPIHAAANAPANRNHPQACRFNAATVRFIMGSPSIVTTYFVVTIIYLVNGGRLSSRRKITHDGIEIRSAMSGGPDAGRHRRTLDDPDPARPVQTGA